MRTHWLHAHWLHAHWLRAGNVSILTYHRHASIQCASIQLTPVVGMFDTISFGQTVSASLMACNAASSAVCMRALFDTDTSSATYQKQKEANGGERRRKGGQERKADK